MIEVIGDPLIHMLRNSVDHGIEMPEEREQAGKPRVGTVWLRARHQENSIVIEIQDDGKGIDPDKLRASAVKKGVITPEAAQRLTDRGSDPSDLRAGFFHRGDAHRCVRARRGHGHRAQQPAAIGSADRY